MSSKLPSPSLSCVAQITHSVQAVAQYDDVSFFPPCCSCLFALFLITVRLRLRSNPGNGLVHFDNFPAALLNVLVVTTMANWTDQLFPLWDAVSSGVAVFYVAIILVCAFFAVNIFLVSVWPVPLAGR